MKELIGFIGLVFVVIGGAIAAQSNAETPGLGLSVAGALCLGYGIGEFFGHDDEDGRPA